MKNFKDMTKEELKQYLSEHRREDENFSEALGELLSRRNPNAKRYPAGMSEEKIKQVIEEKISHIV